ncbi:glycosyltransferase [Inconstantimicrobium mannanitabidum]|uniref:Glycosyl transferase n=1 Tax=Inconstantimicrobium mannanitabidum TaxID=1604901 RepID=A0ACB5R934_9CLOT|nr:glycosyltransferase [Clostridium sp. TW13]GKX65533.1 glycosyl transferase [Clostridium sp. TW13]
MISVIMSVYNAEKYLDESVKSILNQTYSDLEFIIVDDDSTDNSLEILREYEKSDKRVIVISEGHRGVVRNVNRGISIAKGEYITRMDADDISDLRRLQIQYDFMEKNIDVDFCGTDFRYFGEGDFSKENDVLKGEFQNIRDAEGEEIIIKRGYSICQPSFFIRKSAIEELGPYDEQYPYAEDLAYPIKFIENSKKIKMIDAILMQVRKHDDSKSTIERVDNAKETMKLRMDYIARNYSLNNKNIAIWGASKGGEILKEYIDGKIKEARVVTFIDSYKEGEVDSIPIIKPDNIGNIDIDVILISTKPGKLFAQKFIDENVDSSIQYFTIYT